jgi:hypothetical protein
MRPPVTCKCTITSRPQGVDATAVLNRGLLMDSTHYCLKLLRGPADLPYSPEFQSMLRVYAHISRPYMQAIASGGLTGEFRYRTSFEVASALETYGRAYLRGRNGRSVELAVNEQLRVLATDDGVAAAIDMLRVEPPMTPPATRCS